MVGVTLYDKRDNGDLAVLNLGNPGSLFICLDLDLGFWGKGGSTSTKLLPQ